MYSSTSVVSVWLQRCLSTALVVELIVCGGCGRARGRLPPEAVAALIQSDAHIGQCVQRSYDGKVEMLGADLWAESLDLNDDGQTEYRVSGVGTRCSCGNAPDSCGEWLVGKVANEYRNLGGYGEPIDTRSNGYRDLVTDTVVEGTTRWRVLYRFNGERYMESECATHTAGKEGYEKVSCASLWDMALKGTTRINR